MELTLQQTEIIQGKVCPYCGRKSEYVDSAIIYGKSYGMVYFCKPCDAWCGVHKGTNNALGRLANSELREFKKQAHFYFDKVWKLNLLTRSGAYVWLSEKLNLPGEYTHIGMFSEKTCKDVIYYSKQLLNDNRRLGLDFGAEPVTEYYEL